MNKIKTLIIAVFILSSCASVDRKEAFLNTSDTFVAVRSDRVIKEASKEQDLEKSLIGATISVLYNLFTGGYYR